jgi:glutamate formiminotransferase/formiminotetrahydrofolate cyclodeaminase
MNRMNGRNRIVECIPNFSEGRRTEVVDEIVSAIASVPGVFLLRRESDVDHNRSVITFAGEPEAVADAAVAGVARAVDLVDLNVHSGQHPRMGAADVVPFVPIEGVTMADCVALARAAAARIWSELHVPVYLYEEAAVVPEHRNLADLRRGQFERIRETIATDPRRAPDVGERRVHPTAGITAVGARKALVAYNIQLGTGDVEIARRIARAVRHSSGGLRYVKALGFELKSKGVAQVSMNLVDYEKTPIHAVFEMVRREAERYGVAVVGSELIGLIPQDALLQSAAWYLRIHDFDSQRVLENRLLSAMSEEIHEDEPDNS